MRPYLEILVIAIAIVGLLAVALPTFDDWIDRKVESKVTQAYKDHQPKYGWSKERK